MSHPRRRLASLLGLAACTIAMGCSTVPEKAPAARFAPSWIDAGTPAGTLGSEREIRYFIDERGAVWDDRGRKLEAPP